MWVEDVMPTRVEMDLSCYRWRKAATRVGVEVEEGLLWKAVAVVGVEMMMRPNTRGANLVGFLWAMANHVGTIFIYLPLQILFYCIWLYTA